MIIVILLMIFAAPATAATMTTATCDGILVTGTTSAACDNHLGDYGTASITFGTNSVTLAADVSSNQPLFQGDPGGGAVTTTATYSQAYTLFVQSGPAGLLFRPCLTVYSGHASGGGSASFTGSGANYFASYGLPGISDPCSFTPAQSGVSSQPIPVAVGVGVSFNLSLSTSASCSAGGGCQFSHFTDSRVSFTGLQFYDSSRNLLSNVSFQFLPTAAPNTSTIPEPSGGWLILLAGVVFGSRQITKVKNEPGNSH